MMDVAVKGRSNAELNAGVDSSELSQTNQRITSDPLNDILQDESRQSPELNAQKEIEELADVTHSSPRDYKGIRSEYGGNPAMALNPETDLIRLKGMGPAPVLSHQETEIRKIESEIEITERISDLGDLEKATAELEVAAKSSDMSPENLEAAALKIEHSLSKLEQNHDLSSKTINTIAVDRSNREFEARTQELKEKLAEYKIKEDVAEVKEEPKGFWGSVGGFFKSLSDDLGITDIAKGNTLTGALKMAGEITGISDVVRCAGCALKGDWKGAATHGAFALMSAGSIVATVATAGAAGGAVLGVMGLKTAAQQGVKLVVKEGFEVAGKELAERAVKKLTTEALEVAGEKAAQKTVQELNHEIAEYALKNGVKEISPEVAQQLTKEIAEQNVSKVVGEMTEKVVKDVGGDWAKMAVNSPNKFVKEMTELGISKDAAKDMQKLIAKGGADKEVQKIMVESMREPMEKRFREGMKGSFEKTLDQGVSEIKDKFKLSDDVAQGMKKGGREGLESGIQKGVKEGLEKGWKKVFDELRKKDLDIDFGSNIEADRMKLGAAELSSSALSQGALFKGPTEQSRFAQTGKGSRIRGQSGPEVNYQLGDENKAA
jgi:hypothetical protein